MKIALRVKEMAEKRGITTPYQLQVAAKLSPSNASKLYHGLSTHISLATLDKLCEILKCTPNDLLLYKKNSTKVGRQ